MTTRTRLAGWGRTAGGRTATRSVAEGRRGRRWREVLVEGGRVVHGLLLETDLDGRFLHLELARADGLWTLHPEADGTLHGNHVASRERDRRPVSRPRSGGGRVEPISGWAFGPDDVVLVEDSPVSQAAIAWRTLRRESSAGGRPAAEPAALGVAAGVIIRTASGIERVDRLTIGRLAGDRWRIGEGSPIEVDGAGLPRLAECGVEPLDVG